MRDSKDKVILVSACLLGVACRYNGTSRKHDDVISMLEGKRFVPICPESLSGLPVPREPAEFDKGDGTTLKSGRTRIIMRDGTDVTREFMRGATETLKIVRLVGAHEAILKDRSPSCGVHQVYNKGKLVTGIGCLTAMLIEQGIHVRSEKEAPNKR